MTRYQKTSLLIFTLTAILALVLLTGSLSRLTFEPGQPLGLGAAFFDRLMTFRPPTGSAGSGDSTALQWFARLLFWVGLPFTILYSIVSPEARKRLLRMLPVFLGIILLLYAFSRLPQQERAETEPQFAAGNLPDQAGEFPAPPTYVADPPQWLLLAANLLVGLIIVGAVWYIWRLIQKNRAQDDSQALIIQEAERALVDLQAGKDLRNTIIQCYAAMSRVLKQDKKIARRRGMTPREFELHLAQVGLDDHHIRQLTRMFERVRYGGKTTGGREEREAMDCLNAIIKTYGKAP